MAFASYIPKPEIPLISIGTRKRVSVMNLFENISGLEIYIIAVVNNSKELTKTEQNASFIVLYCVIHTSAINPSTGYKRNVKPCIAFHIVIYITTYQYMVDPIICSDNKEMNQETC